MANPSVKGRGIPAPNLPPMDSRRFRCIFFRSVSTMLSAGIPLHGALANLEEQFPEGRERAMCRDLSTMLRQGHRFSQAISRYSWCFGGFHRALLRVAEETGSLDLVLQRLSRYEETGSDLSHKVRSQLSYPAFLLLAALAMLLFLPAFALEGIFEIIESSGQTPPLLTSVFMELSRALRNPLVIVGLSLGAALCIWLAVRAWQREEFRRLAYSWGLRVPVLRELLRSLATALFTQSLAVQLEVGLTPLKAISLASFCTENPVLMEEAKAAEHRLREGESLAESLACLHTLPMVFHSMMIVGEESGKLPTLLERLGRFYEEEVERSLEALTSLLEPLVLAVMGALFAVMLVATMLPMVRLVQTL